MENIINTIVNVYHHIPASTWEVLAASGGVSLVLEFVKKKLSLESDKVIAALLGGLSFATVAVNYILVAANQNPTVLGQQTATIVGVATLLYRYLIKPGTTLVSDAKALRLQATTPTNISQALNTPAPGVAAATQALIGNDIGYEHTPGEPSPSASSNEATF